MVVLSTAPPHQTGIVTAAQAVTPAMSAIVDATPRDVPEPSPARQTPDAQVPGTLVSSHVHVGEGFGIASYTAAPKPCWVDHGSA